MTGAKNTGIGYGNNVALSGKARGGNRKKRHGSLVGKMIDDTVRAFRVGGGL